MKQGNIILEIVEAHQTAGTSINVETVTIPKVVPLEAHEFERLLERAAEILNLREEIAA